MTAPAYWAWARDGKAMHAWQLTEEQVQQVKRTGEKQKAVCGYQGPLGERPVVMPSVEPWQYHCPACWRRQHPQRTVWDPAVVTTAAWGAA